MKSLRLLISILLLMLALPLAQATISSQGNRVGPYTATALPATLAVTFPYQQGSDLTVLDLGQSGTSNDPPVTLTLNSDYTVTGGGYNATNNMQAGNVVVVTGGAHNVQTNDQIVILRNTPVTQLTYFPAGGVLTGAMIEKALDKGITVSQMLTETTSRGLRFEPGEVLDGTLVRSARASKLLGFDANGNVSYYTVGSGGGGGSYTAGTGLVLTGTVFSVNPVQTLTTLGVTTISWLNNTGLRTTKANMHLSVVNVKDYGAVGDGAADDTIAINLAIGALTNYSSLYFPAGRYKNTGFNALASLTSVRVYGEGATLYNATTGAAGNTFVVNSTCSNIHFDHLMFVGAATVRGNGIHIRLYSSYSSVTDCYFTACSDFAIHVSNDSSAYNIGTRVENNTIVAPLGDGIHGGNVQDLLVSGNTLINTGDDSIGIIADDTSFPSTRVTVVGNHIYNSGSAGIRINEVNDGDIIGNDVHTTVAAGIEVNRYLSTTAYNTRVNVKSNKLYNTQTTVGPRGSIWINFANDCSVTDNEIVAPVSGGAIVYLDVNNLTIRANTIKASPVRAIAADDSTTTNVAATWSGVIIQGNSLQSVTANEAIYAVPASGKTITNLLIDGNVANSLPSGNWIYYARVTTGVISNNMSRDSRTVANGGTVSGVTEYNNNFSGGALGTMATQNANAVAITGGSINGLTLIGGTTGQIGNLIMKSGQINEYTTNALGSVDLNYDGYNGGTTQFRNVNFYDGKNGLGATFTGSTKAFNVVGALSAGTGQFVNAGIGTAPLSDRTLYMTHAATSGSAVAAVELTGTLTAPAATDLHPNGFRDTTNYTSTVNADAYASYDALSGVNGTHDYNHFYGYQARIGMNGSGTLNIMAGFTAFMAANAGTTTFARAFYVPNLVASVGVAQYDGLYIDQLASGTVRHAIYAAGNDPWFSAGGQIYTSALLTTPAGDATMRMGATFDQATQTGIGVMNSNATATGKMISFFNNGGTLQGSITQTNSTTIAYNTSSDRRLKENIRDYTTSGTIIDALQPRLFDWKGGSHDAIGFVAQEVNAVDPVLARIGAVTVGDDDPDVITRQWQRSDQALVPILVAELKSLRARVSALEAH